MRSEFATLPHVPLLPGTPLARAPRRRNLPLDAPALAVMTDLEAVEAVTVDPEVPIDDALERMKTAGVRMLLVVDESEAVVGLITAKDIQGERPVQLARDAGIPHAEIRVRQMMVPQTAIEVLTMKSLRNAQVGHVVATLRAIERQHALVVDVDDQSGEQTVRGVFSTSEIGKRIGHPVDDVMTGAHSLAELQQVIAGSG